MQTNVLLIEDEDSFAFLVEQMLGLGYLVRREKTLLGGLKVVAENGIEVVLLDLTLPDSVDAAGTLRQFFELHSEVAVLILSNHSNPDLMMQALEVGAQGYLVKRQINADWLRAAVFQAVLIRQYQSRHRERLTVIFQELYQVWEEESVRLYQLAEGLGGRAAGERGDAVYAAAEAISDRLARLAQFIAPEIREG